MKKKQIYIGTKITKEEYKKDDGKFYRECVKWCYENNTYIEDKGDYYEICEKKPYEPTVQEQVMEYENQIEHINKVMLKDIIAMVDEESDDIETAKRFFREKQTKRKELIAKINELKNKEV